MKATSLSFSIRPDDSDLDQKDHLVGIGPNDDDEPKPTPPDDKPRWHLSYDVFTASAASARTAKYTACG